MLLYEAALLKEPTDATEVVAAIDDDETALLLTVDALGYAEVLEAEPQLKPIE